MKVQLDCIPCFQRQALQAVRFVTDDRSTHERVLRDVMRGLLDLSWTSTPPEIAHVVHRQIRDLVAEDDPYREVKISANEHALQLYPRFKRELEASEDAFAEALKLAILGNVIDLGALDSYDLEKTLETMMEKPLAIDDTATLRSRLRSADSILYFADNAGEIVFDRLFLETLREIEALSFDTISFVVKGGPIINDATITEAKEAGLDSIPNLQFRTVAAADPDSGPERGSQIVQEWIAAHDVTISKGQGNYEAMNEFDDVFFLLMVKCAILARDLDIGLRELVCWHSG